MSRQTSLPKMSRNNRHNLLSSGTVVRRNQYSCQQCRKDKQKCSPSPRDWKSRNERCERCVKLDHACGPSLKSPKRLSNATVSNARLDVMARVLAETDSLKIVDDISIKKSCHTSPEYLPELQGFGTLAYYGNISQIPLESSIEKREKIRTALARLADMNTAREMLLEARRYTDSVKPWFREASIFVQTLGVLIEELETQFHREIADAIDNVGAGVEAESDIAVSAILQAHQRFSYPHVLGGNRTTFAESSHMQKILHLSRRTRKGVASDPFCGSTREIISGDDDKYNTVLAYMDASEAIAHVLESLDSNSRQLKAHKCRRFPGDQIAYMYGNNSATLQLWSLSQERASSVDVLGRNLLHVVVHNSDRDMLRSILSLQGTYATAIDATDVSGVTPLEIAVCQDDLECFLLLTSHGARQDTAFSKHGDSLIGLAKRNNSSKVFGHMLKSGILLSDPSPESCEAFQSNTDEIMSPITSNPDYVASLPQETFRCQNIGLEDLNESAKRENDQSQDHSASAFEIDFDNMDTWTHWQNVDVNTQFAVANEYVEMVLPITVEEALQI